MIKLQYFAHLILQSRYKLFINIFVISIIYIFIYNDKIVSCMNNNLNITDTPAQAESKVDIQTTPEAHALREEIKSFAGTTASLMEDKEKVISNKNDVIRIQKEHIAKLQAILRNKDSVNNELQLLKRHIIEEGAEDLLHLSQQLVAERQTIVNLNNEITELNKHIAELEDKQEYMLKANSNLHKMLSLEEENRKLAHELQAERNRIVNLKKELKKTKHLLKDRFDRHIR